MLAIQSLLLLLAVLWLGARRPCHGCCSQPPGSELQYKCALTIKATTYIIALSLSLLFPSPSTTHTQKHAKRQTCSRPLHGGVGSLHPPAGGRTLGALDGRGAVNGYIWYNGGRRARRAPIGAGRGASHALRVKRHTIQIHVRGHNTQFHKYTNAKPARLDVWQSIGRPSRSRHLPVEGTLQQRK